MPHVPTPVFWTVLYLETATALALVAVLVDRFVL